MPITITLPNQEQQQQQLHTPESPSTPTQVTLIKAPTPWLQNKNKPQDELPEWAKRAASVNKQVSINSNSRPSECTISPTVAYNQFQQSQESLPHNRAPTKQKQQSTQLESSQKLESHQQYQDSQSQIIDSIMSQRSKNPQTHQQQQQQHIIPIRVSLSESA